jgi:hypothetical protein
MKKGAVQDPAVVEPAAILLALSPAKWVMIAHFASVRSKRAIFGLQSKALNHSPAQELYVQNLPR